MNKFPRFYIFFFWANYISLFDAPHTNIKSWDFTVITSLYYATSCPFRLVCCCCVPAHNSRSMFFSSSIPRSLCGMSCYVAGAGMRQDGRNQRTVQAGGRARSGEWYLVMMSVGTLWITTWLVLTDVSGLLGYDALLLGCVPQYFERSLGNGNHDMAPHPRIHEFSTRSLREPQIVLGIPRVESWDWHFSWTSPPGNGVCYALLLKLF